MTSNRVDGGDGRSIADDDGGSPDQGCLPRCAEQLVAWGYGNTEMLGGVVGCRQCRRHGRGCGRACRVLYDRFERASASPGDDLLGDLVRAAVAGELDRDVAVLMLVQPGVQAAVTAGLIGNWRCWPKMQSCRASPRQAATSRSHCSVSSG